MATRPPMAVPASMQESRDTNAVVAHFDEELADRRRRFSTTVADLFGDAVVTDELIRLRSAEHTRCEYCGNIRKRAAHDAGLGEDLVQGMLGGHRDHLSTRDQAALALADDFYMECPGDIARATEVLGEAAVAAVLRDLVRFGAGGHALVLLRPEPEHQERVLV